MLGVQVVVGAGKPFDVDRHRAGVRALRRADRLVVAPIGGAVGEKERGRDREAGEAGDRIVFPECPQDREMAVTAEPRSDRAVVSHLEVRQRPLDAALRPVRMSARHPRTDPFDRCPGEVGRGET